MKQRIPSAIYSKEFRERAVKLVMEEGLNPKEAARRLSVRIYIRILAKGCAGREAGAWIDMQRKDFGLDEMCMVLDVTECGYRAWKCGGKPYRKRLTEAQMLTLIQAIHIEFKGAYGSPRMVRELRLRGFPASKERVERLMQENGIRAKHKRRFKVTTDSKHNLPIAPNLLDRNFAPSAPNQVWTSGHHLPVDG